MYRQVFVTGATSEIIQALLRQRIFNDAKIVCLSRQQQSVSSGSVKWVQGDLLDTTHYSDYLKHTDLVIHGAAVTHSRNPADYFRINFEGTKRLVDACVRNRAGQFLFVSSRAAVPGSGGYGESKLAAEEYVRGSVENHLIVRPSEVFGVSRHEGIEKLIQGSLKGRVHVYPANVPSDLYPIHVSDLVTTIVELLSVTSRGQRTEEITGNRGYDYRGLIMEIGRWTGRRHWAFPVPRGLLRILVNGIKLLGLPIGPTPDQIPRLYAVKRTVNERNTAAAITLEQYVVKLAETQRP